jgi:hypothetical protein
VDTIKDPGEATAWQEEHDARAPKRGDEAPDFELRDAAGEKPVRLSSLLGDKPVALVFGSFT